MCPKSCLLTCLVRFQISQGASFHLCPEIVCLLKHEVALFVYKCVSAAYITSLTPSGRGGYVGW